MRSSDLDVLLQHITFVEPLISPIRSDSSFSSEDTSTRKKRPLCSPRFDDVPKRLAFQADEQKAAKDPIPLIREQPATSKARTVMLLLTKQSFLRLLEQQVHDKKMDRTAPQAHQTPPQEAPLANGSAGGQPQQTEQEIVAMEGTERRAVEARIQSLRNISILLDAALLQFQQYLSIITSPGITSLVQLQRDENSAQNPSTSTARTTGVTQRRDNKAQSPSSTSADRTMEETNPDQQQTGTET